MKIKITTMNETEKEILFPFYTGTENHSTCWLNEHECISVEHTLTEESVCKMHYQFSTPLQSRLNESVISMDDFNDAIVNALNILHDLVVSVETERDEREYEAKQIAQEISGHADEEHDHERENMDAIRSLQNERNEKD